eukprot:TRINITY_DN55343_c0_g1_i2.p1 TRINITY_DN55343_c0_g1~~TRINITY_DN55343_c0_g1_i2.p1  ORF type:complete len:284 (-),score=23.41 TRINITY_DN55343_c0_g1_i2:97-948(-)
MDPLFDQYDRWDSSITFVAARSKLYAHQFGLDDNEHAVIFHNMDNDDHPLNSVYPAFTLSSESVAQVSSHLQQIASASHLDYSHQVVVVDAVATNEETKRVREAFGTCDVSDEQLKKNLDSVDRRPAFETYLEDAPHCRCKPLCSYSREIINRSILPSVTEALETWKKQGVLAEGTHLEPCESFVRRYLPLERRSLNPHRDDMSLVTVNVLLSDPSQHVGGLLVYPEAVERNALGPSILPRVELGGAIIHRGDVFHGVSLKRGQRYSWIIWFRPNCSSRDFGQ